MTCPPGGDLLRTRIRAWFEEEDTLGYRGDRAAIFTALRAVLDLIDDEDQRPGGPAFTTDSILDEIADKLLAYGVDLHI